MTVNNSIFQKIDNIGLAKACLIIVIMAMIVRFSYIFFFIQEEYLLLEDQKVYINLALEYSKTGFLGMTPERAPGYPLFLSSLYSIFSENQLYIITVQAVIDSISCILIGLLAQAVFSRSLLIAGIMSALNMNMIILSATILTDTLFLFIFLIFLLLLVKYLQRETWLWLFLSVATLVRPVAYYLLPILLIGLVIWRIWQKDGIMRIITMVALYIFFVALVLGGIHHRNYTKYNSTAFASDTGKHLLGWVVPATYQYSGKGTYQDGQLLAYKKLNLAQKRDNLPSLPSNEFDASAYQIRVGKDILSELGFVSIIKAWSTGFALNLLAPSVAYAPIVRAMEHPSFYATRGNNGADKLYNYISSSGFFIY